MVFTNEYCAYATKKKQRITNKKGESPEKKIIRSNHRVSNL